MIGFNIHWKGQGKVLRGLLRLKDDLDRKRVLTALARVAVDLIKVRTLSGLDENDRPIIASKRASFQGGQTLSDRGHMLGAMRVLGVTANRATIGFGSLLEAKKAWWAHEGTRAHDIFPKNGKALAWKGKTMYGKSGKLRKTSRSVGNVYAHVHHPGTPPRPFFGISPRDGAALQDECNRLVSEALAAAEGAA